jgi:hypothetical protein
MLSLRVRSRQAQLRLDKINPDSTLNELKKQIADQCGIIVERQISNQIQNMLNKRSQNGIPT